MMTTVSTSTTVSTITTGVCVSSGVGVRVGRGVGVAVAVGDGVDVEVEVTVAVAVGEGVGVRVGERVGPGVAVTTSTGSSGPLGPPGSYTCESVTTVNMPPPSSAAMMTRIFMGGALDHEALRGKQKRRPEKPPSEPCTLPGRLSRRIRLSISLLQGDHLRCTHRLDLDAGIAAGRRACVETLVLKVDVDGAITCQTNAPSRHRKPLFGHH
jgi:hypothetical protein